MWERQEGNKISAGLLAFNIPVFNSLSDIETFKTFPFSIILTHACDLESHYKSENKFNTDGGDSYSRQLISQILLCPSFEEEKFTDGIHLQNQYNFKVEQISKKEKEHIRKLKNTRYHYISSSLDEIPNLFIDFKHYFTLPVQLLKDYLEKRQQKFYKLDHISYTQLADRFAYYIQRVAFP